MTSQEHIENWIMQSRHGTVFFSHSKPGRVEATAEMELGGVLLRITAIGANDADAVRAIRCSAKARIAKMLDDMLFSYSASEDKPR